MIAHWSRRLRYADLPQQLTDEQLANLASEGLDSAFELLVGRYRRRLVSHCARLVGSADAEEAVQEALIRAYLSLVSGRRVRSAGPWLRTIAHNTALNLRRSRELRPAAGQPTSQPQAEIDEFKRREDLRLIVEALRALPERQREALVMQELEGRSYAEIETRLRTSNGAVRQLLSRARASLRGGFTRRPRAS